jgi:hypothetical protein
MATMRSAVAGVFFGAVAIGVELACAELVGSLEFVELAGKLEGGGGRCVLVQSFFE